ncbi:hypothetical protein P8452_71498 [Trifolium repens]|nr:hypothetical protein P8452_71498 [Trifolium repens]
MLKKTIDLHLLSLDLLSVAAQSPIRRPPLSLSHIRRTFPPTTALTLSYPPHLCSVNLKPYHLSASRLLQRPLLSIFSGSQDCKRSVKSSILHFQHYFPQFPPGGIPSSHPNTVLHAGTPSAPSYTPFMTTLEEVERSAKLRKL